MRLIQVAGILLVGAAAPARSAAQTQIATARPAAARADSAKGDSVRADSVKADSAAAPGLQLGSVKISGYAEASYSWSTRPADRAISGRLYDRFHNQFELNALKVVLDRPYAADKLSAGFHTDIILGENASVLQSSGLKLGDQGDLTQLYVTLNVPTPNGNGFQLKLGKIATLMGLEVIEDPVNPNWSIGNLFSFVENFTAVGLSAEYRFNRLVDAQFRVIDGWDVVQDNNSGQSVMGRVGLAPDTLTSLAFVGYFGPEAAASSAKRYGGEVILSRKLTPKLGASLQGDYGREERLVPTGGADRAGPADWWGAGAWLTVDATPALGVALRADLVDDRDGVRSNGFLFPSFAEGPGTRHRFGSGTVTLNVKAWPNVLVRPELRYDRSNLSVYRGRRDQFTTAFSIAYLY